MADESSARDGDGGQGIPRHVAIIMDGNGRWANARDLPRTAGHASGEPALFDVIEGALDMGIEWLTVYAFSTENWSRSDDEVEFLMYFNVDLFRRRRNEMNDFGVRIHFIGERDDARVPDELRAEIVAAEELTVENERMHLVFAFNYGGRTELGTAAMRLAADVAAGTLEAGDIDEHALTARLYLPQMPDPDLVIRTSGEMRTSNFLLWQSAYSEYVFTPTLWPDFDRHTLVACVAEYRRRSRRFGAARDTAPSEAT